MSRLPANSRIVAMPICENMRVAIELRLFQPCLVVFASSSQRVRAFSPGIQIHGVACMSFIGPGQGHDGEAAIAKCQAWRTPTP